MAPARSSRAPSGGSEPAARPSRRRRGAGRRPRTIALIAARNEAGCIAETVGALCASGAVDDVVVVDDGSSDGTAGLANRAGARVLVSPRNIGKGGALDGALDRLEPAARYLLVDGDVGATATCALRLLDALDDPGVDLAIGVLPPLSGGGFGLVKRLSRSVIRALGGPLVDAPMSGQRAVSAEALSACRPLARGFAVDAAMTADAARLGFGIVEVPVDMRHRATGRTPEGFAHRARQGLHVLLAAVPRALRLR